MPHSMQERELPLPEIPDIPPQENMVIGISIKQIAKFTSQQAWRNLPENIEHRPQSPYDQLNA